ncbi:MAG: lipid IV(A) 3-deoxy-D-manno-octulosonic acid transferase [Oceanisphaera sp.]|uniref:lipid IV(A) 3-deoxy-D-manno-octulosonic acid transferase n=1 Tax=Oceanisphaera sp. TaxID=1929979 RepID=UPI003F9495C5
MIYRLLYNLLIHLFSPLLLAMLYWPKKGKPSFGKRWPEHLGWVAKTQQTHPVWLHAVSVGEMVAATPLIKALKVERPDLPILVTTTTRTGADLAEKLGDLIEHRYAPLDFPWAVALFLRRVRPRALLIMETELWPNWLTVCGKRQLPVMVLNARLSERSAARYRQFQGVFNLLSNNIRHICCQHQDDAERFAALGLAAEKLSITGSIKFDIEYDDEIIQQGQQLRKQLGAKRPVWIAASTHEGEDEQVLAAHQQLLAQLPDALLILVPRHPQRFDQVVQLATEQGFNIARRTTGSTTTTTQVYVGDTMGELPIMLASADVAFVGGSLIERGGHNLLEPAALAKPVITGPSIFNFSDISHSLNNSNALLKVKSSNKLSEHLFHLFKNPHLITYRGNNAKKVVHKNKGALLKTVKFIINKT